MNSADTVRRPSRLGIETTTVNGTMWLTLSGEADLSNHEQLKAALAEIDVRGVRQVHLRLSNLTFCDVRGFSELLTFAQDCRHRRLGVRMEDASPWVHLMATLLDVGGELGLSAQGGREMVEMSMADADPLLQVKATRLDVDGEFELHGRRPTAGSRRMQR